MDMITSHTHYTELIQYEGGNKMDNLKKSHSYLMREGFAVMVDENKGQWRTVAMFSGWIDAHNYLNRNVGANHGKVVHVKEIQGKTEDK